MYMYNCLFFIIFRYFIVSISSGLIGSFLNLLLLIILFIIFFADRSLIRYYCHAPYNVTGCDSTLRLFGAPIPDPLFPTVNGVIGLVSGVSTVLLGHLLAFHSLLSKRCDYI